MAKSFGEEKIGDFQMLELLSKRITPTAMMDRFKKICEERADLRVLLYILGPEKILEWMHSIGVCEDDALRSFVPPFPPAELRKITAAPHLEEFLWTGLADMERIITLYETVDGFTYPKRPVVLDFGCGCGRMVRFLANCANSWIVHACEVNPRHVQWCQDNLENASTSQCNPLPPLPYQDQSFDLVYCISVFTHLPESRAFAWLSEMARVLVHNGILIITTHGPTALAIIRDSEAHQKMFNLDRQTIVAILESLKESLFVFQKYAKDALENALAGEEYGNAFIHPDYIYSQWGVEGLKVLQYLPGGLRGWQDIVIIQRN